MFLKYEKTYRIPIPQIKVPGKLVLSKADIKRLLAGSVDIEEKLDGANVGIIRHRSNFALQKRGSLVGQSEHLQYQFFHAWANRIKYDNIMSVPYGYRIYGELCHVVHTIYYDSLPDYVIVIDVMKDGVWLNRKDKEAFCDKYGFAIVPLIAQGYFNLDELWGFVHKGSYFGDTSEGIIVKKFHKKKGYMRGKIVKPEFIRHMEESDHWMRSKLKTNKLVGDAARSA